MARDFEEAGNMFAMGAGCPIHGEEHMRECAACGVEFCRVCCPRSLVCPNCAEDEEEVEEKGEPDFEDVRKLDAMLDEDAGPKTADAEDEEESP